MKHGSLDDNKPASDPPQTARASMRLLSHDDLGHCAEVDTRFQFVPKLAALIGRNDMMREVATALTQFPVVSLLGACGVGKTALARRFASNWQNDGTDRWCRWIAVDELDSTVGDAFVEGLSPHDEVLLVLDDARVGSIDRLGSMIALWLGRSPRWRLLLTAERRLGLDGEGTVVVRPLKLDQGVALFETEARAVDARYVPTAEETTATRDIVGLVGALPLAIKVCASQTIVLRPVALLEHLRQPAARLQMRGASGLALRETVGAAVELLDPAARQALAGCVVFEGPFSFSAAAAVVGATLSDLKGLTDRSLLEYDDGPSGRLLRLLPLIADYLGARSLNEASTETDTWDALTARHSAFYRGPASDALGAAEKRRNLLCAAARASGAGLWDEAGEALQKAANWVLQQGGVTAALAVLEAAPQTHQWTPPIAFVKAQLLVRQGRLQAAAQTLKSLEGHEGEFGAKVALECAGVARLSGDSEAAQAAYRRAVAASEPGAARALAVERWAGHCFELGDSEGAEKHFATSAAIYDELGDAMGLARVDHAMGMVAQQSGDLDQARQRFEAAEARHRALGDVRLAAIASFDLAALTMEEGSWRAAVDMWPEIMTALRAVGEQRQLVLARALYAVCQFRGGAVEDARALLAASAAEAKALSDALFVRAITVHAMHLHGPRADVATAMPKDRPAAVSDEERFAWRLLDMARASDEQRIVVARDGATMTSGGQEAAIRSTAARLILVALCRQPGKTISAQGLVAVGWPGDRSLSDSAKNRLHVALSALRKAGLGDRLKRDGDGYALSATVAWLSGDEDAAVGR